MTINRPQPDSGRNKPRGASSDLSGRHTPRVAQIASGEAEIPSRWLENADRLGMTRLEDRLASALASATVELCSGPSSQDRAIVALAIRLADTEAEREAATEALKRANYHCEQAVEAGERALALAERGRRYTDAQREEAITRATNVDIGGMKTVRGMFGRIVVGKIVDAVAQALGMERAS